MKDVSVGKGGRAAAAGWLGPRRACAVADASLLSLTAAAVAAALSGTDTPARLVLVLATACLVPGAAILTLLRVDDVLEAAALAIGLGIALEALGPLVMIWTGFWHPVVWGALLAAAASLRLIQDLRCNAASTASAF